MANDYDDGDDRYGYNRGGYNNFGGPRYRTSYPDWDYDTATTQSYNPYHYTGEYGAPGFWRGGSYAGNPQNAASYGWNRDYQNARGIPRGPHAGKGPKNYHRSDERIQDDVNDRLTEHGNLDARDIEVRVQSGVVTLTGTVDSRQQKRMAEDVADSVTGVQDVHNELRINHAQYQGQQAQQPQSVH